MKTLTNTPVLLSMSASEIKYLSQQIVNETLDAITGQPQKKMSAATMWKIHGQRRGMVIRKGLR